LTAKTTKKRKRGPTPSEMVESYISAHGIQDNKNIDKEFIIKEIGALIANPYKLSRLKEIVNRGFSKPQVALVTGSDKINAIYNLFSISSIYGKNNSLGIFDISDAPNNINKSILRDGISDAEIAQFKNNYLRNENLATGLNAVVNRSVVLSTANGDDGFEISVLKDDEIEPGKVVIRDEIYESVANYESNKANEEEKGIVNKMGDIPFYIVVILGRRIHASIIIKIGAQMYTFGFGYGDGENKEYMANISAAVNKYGKPFIEAAKEGRPQLDVFPAIGEKIKIAEGAIYSPDYFISVNEPRHHNDIIDIGILTNNHLQRIEEFIRKVTKINSRLSLEPGGTIISLENVLTGRELNAYVSHVGACFNRVVKNVARDKVVLNCAGFIEQIFPHINCNDAWGITSMPIFCKTNPPIEEDKILSFIDLYGQDGDEAVIAMENLLRREEDESMLKSCSIMGGKYKSKRKTKTKTKQKKIKKQTKKYKKNKKQTKK
jgi:hypothetical protein